MPRRRLLDDAQSAEVVRRYVAGETIAELAEDFGVSTKVIHGRLLEADVVRRSTGRQRAEVDVDELVRRYREGSLDVAARAGAHARPQGGAPGTRRRWR